MNNIWRRTLLLALLGLAASVFAASPEYMVGTTVTTPAPSLRGGTAVATDGTDFFVVWGDYRTPNSEAIIGTRVTRDGRVLDPLGIRIATTLGSGGGMRMVWDGGAYLVVWTAAVYVDGVYTENHSVYAARIDREGRLAMAPRVIVENAMTTYYTSSVASNGTVTVIPYLSNERPGQVNAVVLDRDGNTLHHEPLPVQPGSNIFIAGTPSRFVVTWSEPRGLHIPESLYALALTGDGHVAGTRVQLGLGSPTAIAANGGTNFLILSATVDPEFGRSTHFARAINADLTPAGDVETIMPTFDASRLSLLWRNGRYELIAARKTEPSVPWEITSIELDTDGDVIATRTRGSLPLQPWVAPSPIAATNGSDVLITFSAEVSDSTWPQVFAGIYRGSSPVPEVRELLSWSGNGHTNPVVAASAHGHLVAWNEESGTYATRVTANGVSLDGRGVLLGAKGRAVRVTFDGTNYVAAWVEPDGIGVRRIAPATGAVVSQTKFAATVWNGIAVAASPDATYVVWTNEHVRVTRIPHATNVADSVPLTVSPEDMGVDMPAAAWNGSTLLVAWNEIFYPRGDPPIALAIKTLAARVTAGLTLLDPAPLVIAQSAEETWQTLGAPAVASNGSDWLIVTDLDARDILARRVRHDGMLEGDEPQKVASGWSSAVTWDGTRFSVAWKDGPNVRLAHAPATGALTLLYRTVVTTDTAPSGLWIAPAANGEIAVTYTKVSFRSEHTGVERTFLRFMDDVVRRGRAVRR